MSVTGAGSVRGADRPRRVAVPRPRPGGEPQRAVLAGLVRVAAGQDVAVVDLLDLVHQGLHRPARLTHTAVYVFDRDQNQTVLVAGDGAAVGQADLRLAVQTYRSGRPRTVAASGPRAVARTAVPLLRRGRVLGVLVLAGERLEVLRADVVDAVALHLALARQSVVDEEDRRSVERTAEAVRRLFEEGTVATSIEAAGEILARVTAEVFGTERAALLLVDTTGRISHTVGVGLPPQMSRALDEALVGRVARGSPIWRSSELSSGPILVDDADLVPVREGGFVRTLQLQSYVAMPLLSEAGLVGMALCGDATGRRTWSARDRQLAQQLALQGALVVDSARLRQAERERLSQMTRQAFHDPLTGLPNRLYLSDRLNAAVGAGARFALLMIDLDGFKQVNDTLGHAAGDTLLQHVAQRLRETVADHGSVTRVGGDEFAVVTGACGVSAATALARRVDERLRQPFQIAEQVIGIGASIGVALCPDHAGDITTLIQAADVAMYRAKRRGGGTCLATVPEARRRGTDR